MSATPSVALLMLLLVAAVVMAALCAQDVSAQLPVPSPGYPGYRMGRVRPEGPQPRPQIQWEVFCDLGCKDCRQFVVSGEFGKVYNYYLNASTAQTDDVIGYFHVFPLPYHICSYELHKASVLVRDRNPQRYVDFLVNIYHKMHLVSNDAVMDKTQYDIQNIIYANMVQQFGIGKDDYNNAMNSYEYWHRARIEFKFATSRGPFGTPSFFVNGVQLVTEDHSFAYFKKLFDSLKKQ